MLGAKKQRRTTQFMAGFWFFSSPAAFRPDVRHWGDDLFKAAPPYVAYEDFLSTLDLDEELEEIEADAKARQEKIKALESIDRAALSAGQAYHSDKQLVELLLLEATYLNFQAQREAYLSKGPWRRPPPLAESDGLLREYQALSFRTLEVARKLVNNANFDGPENLALLIRLLGRTHNDNIHLFAEQFVKKYPSSPLLAQVQHTLAEYYAHAGEWDKAEAKVKAAMENKSSPLRPYSVYKLAWIHIMKVAAEKDAAVRAEAFKKAQVAFRLSHKLMEEWKGDDPVFDLKNEALIDLAWMMAENRTPSEEAKKFFATLDAEDAYRSYLYYRGVDAVRDGDFRLAHTSFNELLPLEKIDSRQQPRLLLNVAELHLRSQDYISLVSTYEKIKSLFAPEHPWLEAWEDDKELQEVSLKQLSQHMAAAASITYQEAEKMSDETAPAPPAAPPALAAVTPTYPRSARAMLFETSKELYRLYGVWYPGGEALQEARYNEALSHFYTGEPEKSLALLSSIAADEGNPFAQQASYNAVLVAVNYDQQAPSPPLPESGKAQAPVPLGRAKALLVERIDTFLARYPEAEERVTLQYMAAQSYYAYGHYPEAIKRFDAIVQSAPETEQGESALHTMLGYEVEAGLWPSVISRCESYLKNKKITAAGHRKILRQTLTYARGQTAT